MSFTKIIGLIFQGLFISAAVLLVFGVFFGVGRVFVACCY
jgi:hypothetical protein